MRRSFASAFLFFVLVTVGAPAHAAEVGWVEVGGKRFEFKDSVAVWVPEKKQLTIFYYPYEIPDEAVRQAAADKDFKSFFKEVLQMKIDALVPQATRHGTPYTAALKTTFDTEKAGYDTMKQYYLVFFGVSPSLNSINITVSSPALVDKDVHKFVFSPTSVDLDFSANTEQQEYGKLNTVLHGASRLLVAK